MDHMNSIRTEWHVLKEKWFHGESMDPVFEGVVRDFCMFDDTMHSVYQQVGVFMKGVEQLANGMVLLSDGVSAGLSQAAGFANDPLIASDSCKLKEATNQIARADAPHSAIAKLRRDMHFNILTPVQNHIANNRNLKVSLDIRRRRLIELNSAKKQYEDVVKKNLAQSDRRYLQAQSTLEAAKITFNDVDRHVFEWLYILEEYRGDILDSTLQTLKYLEYEFFATSAHAISTSLPTRMEFRPMVEMTPEHLEAQVEMELQESSETGTPAATEGPIADFSARLIDKKVKEAPKEGDPGPALPVDPLSLSSLLSQGFEEGPARRALRLHQNNTQAALDWLINGQGEDEEKRKQVSEGVRMPTTVKRVQKLKAMRKAQQDKLRDKRGEAAAASGSAADHPGDAASNGSSSRSNGGEEVARPRAATPPPAAPPSAPRDMLSGSSPDVREDLVDMGQGAPANAGRAGKSAAVADLLSLDDDVPAEPTDFSKPVERTQLPPQMTFDSRRCEKQPLPAAVAAGIAQRRDSGFDELGAGFAPPPRTGQPSASTSPVGLDFGTAQAGVTAAAPAAAGIPLELLTTIQALAAQSQVTPDQLIYAAQQLAAQGSSAGAPPAVPQLPSQMPLQPPQAPQARPAAGAPGAQAGAGWPGSAGSPANRGGAPPKAGTGEMLQGGSAFEGLDPFGSSSGLPPSGSMPAAGSADSFGDLMSLAAGGRPQGPPGQGPAAPAS